MVKNALMTIGWHIARNIAGVIAALILAGTPILGTLALAAIPWYATGGHLPATLMIWFVLMIFGSNCVYSPYLQPLNLRVVNTIMEWIDAGDLERSKARMKRKGIPLKDDDMEA